jgi:hypothetical protein
MLLRENVASNFRLPGTPHADRKEVFLYILVQLLRYEGVACKIIYKIAVRTSCKMNLIWYMVPEYPSKIHLRQATLSVSGGLQGQSAIVSPCRAGQYVEFLN